MIRLHDPAGCETTPASGPSLSTTLLRRVLVGGRHTIGQRVLVAGSRCGELVERLRGLGYDVDALGFRGQNPLSVWPEGTGLDTRAAQLLRGELNAGESYDLILITELDRYRGSLVGLDARLTTARLLACLKPEGEFVVVHEVLHKEFHDSACWTRHLACFPGHLETLESSNCWFRWPVWNWLRTGARPRRDLAISLRAPLERLSAREWYEHARRGLLTGAGACCSAAAPQHQQFKAA
jgi:hypothetical protein